MLNGRYRVDAKLGEGGFGAVYRGVEVATGRPVALKLLHADASRDANLVARFRREGDVACSLHDPHTITTYELAQTPEGTLYIAMELLSGRSLATMMQQDRVMVWPRALRIVSEICSSLGEAHARGIVHRDLKPDNIYLENRDGNPEFVKVLDFGMAKIVQGEQGGGQAGEMPKLTQTGQTLGTLEYMSPEQLMGSEKLDARSDLYALGALTYEMITGQLPFPNIKQPVALMMAQLKQEVPPPSVAQPNNRIPPEVDALVLRCLDKRKEARFADVRELAAAINALIAPPAPPVQQPVVQQAPAVFAPPPVQIQAPPPPGVQQPPPYFATANPPPPTMNPPAPQVMHQVPPVASGGSKTMLIVILLVVVLGGIGAAVVFLR